MWRLEPKFFDKYRLQELENLLLSYDLINTVNSPTRITSSSESLIDVIVTNKEYLDQSTTVIDLDLSDHLAQLIRIRSRKKKQHNKNYGEKAVYK